MILKKTRELYGKNVNPKLWANMTYIEVLEDKIRLVGEQLTELNLVEYPNKDHTAISACMDSVSLCRDLIKETQ